MNTTDREAWLTQAADLLLEGVILPAMRSAGLSREFPKVRVSVGYGKHSRKAKGVAQCFARAASTGGYNEIFVNPETQDNMTILTALTEAVIAAVDDCQSGRRGLFARIRREAGFNRDTVEPKLLDQLEIISGALGQIPHARLDLDAVHNKQSTRQLKVYCPDSACGFVARASAKQAARWVLGDSRCPCCRTQLLFPEV